MTGVRDGSAPRTERQVAALVVAALFHHKVLPRVPKARQRVEALIGVNETDLRWALQELVRTGGRVLLSPTQCEPEPEPEPRPRRHRGEALPPLPRPAHLGPPKGRRRRESVIDGVRHLWCTGGPDYPGGHWVPETGFSRRSDRKWGLRSKCHQYGCWAAYQRSKRLTVRAIKELDAAGIIFDVDADDATLRCASCGQPIAAGERAVLAGRARHATCLAGATPEQLVGAAMAEEDQVTDTILSEAS